MSQRTHDATTVPPSHRNDAATSFFRQNDVATSPRRNKDTIAMPRATVNLQYTNQTGCVHENMAIIGRFPGFVFEPFTVPGAFSMPVEANPDTPGGPIESQWDLRRYPGQPRQNWFSCLWCSIKVSIRIKGNWISICGLENGEPGTMICVHQWGNRKMYNTWQYLEISVKAASR